MNRWRCRLAELERSHPHDRLPVHNVQIVQYSPAVASCERIEQIEHVNAIATPSQWADIEEERAAIAEYDGGALREWAEALARLDSRHPPEDVPLRRWLRFLDDAGRFIDGGWAEQSRALGWHARDLFGCDRQRPFARVERAGLVWLLNGWKLIALTRDAAVVEGATGARQTYRRAEVPHEDVVLAWEFKP